MKEEPIDILFIVSDTDDISKLKLNLRTVEAHVKDYRDIHVVGIDISKHFCSSDKSRMCNHIIKNIGSESAHYDPKPIVRACQLVKDISMNFVLMNLKGVVCGDLNTKERMNYFADMEFGSEPFQVNTQNIINVHDLKQRSFDQGHPVFVNKLLFIETMNRYRYEMFVNGFMFRSIYMNSITELKVKDVFEPIEGPILSTVLKENIRERNVLIFKEGEFDEFTQEELFKIYNTPSQWEL